jgi:hypothetical protein
LSIHVVEDLNFRIGIHVDILSLIEKIAHDFGDIFDDGILIHPSQEHPGLQGIPFSDFHGNLMHARSCH